MKKSLLFMAFLFIMGGLCANAAVDKIPNPTVAKSYADITLIGNETEVEYLFASTNQQNNPAVYQIRHSKSSYITNKTCAGNIESVSFTLSGAVNVYGSNEAYTTYEQTPTKGTKQVINTVGEKSTVVFDGDYQYFYIVSNGTTISKLSDIEFSWNDGTPQDPVAYEPNFEDVEIWEGNTFALNLGAKHPAEMIFVSGDETVATVSDAGVITAEGIGTTTISVAWDADANFTEGEAEFTVNVVEKPLMYTWTLTGVVDPTNKGGADLDSDLESEGDNGVWHAVKASSYGATSSGKVQLGSSSYTFANGVLSLSGSDLASGATVEAVSMTLAGGKDGSSSWQVTVNGVKCENLLSFEGTESVTKKIEVGLVGDEITLTCTSAVKAVYLENITIYYSVPECPYDAEALTPAHAEGTVALDENGVAVIEIENGDLDGVAIHYMHTPAEAPEAVVRRAIAEGYSEAALVDGVHSITVNAPGSVSYYGYHAASGAKGVERTVTVTPYENTTGIENVGVDAGEGEVEWFNLQGVKVEVPVAGGLYIRRQGGEVSKVIVK